ncbi:MULTISPECIES: uracil-DNA glycosylase [Protofrankia]|uniref:Type-5 uracil-DNA glycosylase n=1 Tax=Candidatus Protofrankia datiscae TaxID=2716812 RepID=F8AVT9_9ACTN|nr:MULTISPECIES: uracil-DNA glycosylase [Protofrankia]AEH08277.1 Uracil-DNA glycosylase superfamily [Candidatus Protofrankia datiscae]
MAVTPGDVGRLAASAADTAELDARMSVCRACPRLVDWREEVAQLRRAAFARERYWGRPVPSFGPADARVLVVGLAPAAHGGNRTGRIFTGDRSGDWLFASLHRVGLARLPTSLSAGDGQRLISTRIVAAVRCAPPANKPTTLERDACQGWLIRDLELLRPTLRAIVVLGGFAWTALWPALGRAGHPVPSPRPAFGHGRRVVLADVPADVPAVGPASSPAGPARRAASTEAVTERDVAGRGVTEHRAGLVVFGCYHPSQQNTFTGRVTAEMIDAVLGAAAEVSGAVSDK